MRRPDASAAATLIRRPSLVSPSFLSLRPLRRSRRIHTVGALHRVRETWQGGTTLCLGRCGPPLLGSLPRTAAATPATGANAGWPEFRRRPSLLPHDPSWLWGGRSAHGDGRGASTVQAQRRSRPARACIDPPAPQRGMDQGQGVLHPEKPVAENARTGDTPTQGAPPLQDAAGVAERTALGHAPRPASTAEA